MTALSGDSQADINTDKNGVRRQEQVPYLNDVEVTSVLLGDWTHKIKFTQDAGPDLEIWLTTADITALNDDITTLLAG